MTSEYSKKLYNRLDDELLDKHSLAALIVYINIGFELEFHYKNISYCIAKLDKKVSLSSLDIDESQKFEDITDLIIHATIDGKVFIDIWDDLILDTI